MRFHFGRGKKLSDVLRVAQFLEENGIEYEMMSDIQLSVGPSTDSEVQSSPKEAGSPQKAPTQLTKEQEAAMAEAGVGSQAPPRDEASILWRGAYHDNQPCIDKTCKDASHLGANYNF